MGLAILLQPKKESRFKIANILWLLAVFGITHGINEELDMWAIIRGRHIALDVVRWFILVASFIFLFEFGRQLFRLNISKLPGWWKKIAESLVWWLLPAIVIFILISSAVSHDFWEIGSIWTRYLLCFPGSILISLGFFSYYNHQKEILGPLKVQKYFSVLGVSFFVYGILGGLVVPKENFFPSNRLNTDSFLLTVKIPVQAFRALCAIISAVAASGMLKIFYWETGSKIQIYQEQLRALITKLSIAEEQERKRISEELHDNISQHLALSNIKLAALRESFPEAAKDIDETRELIEQTIKFTRSLTYELSPPILYQLGFRAAVEGLAEQIQKRHGIEVEFSCDSELRELNAEISFLLFKTLRELLLNIVKHAQSDIAIVSISRYKNNLQIIVEDKGIGFDTSKIDRYTVSNQSFGLFSIHERIKYLGGTLEIASKPEQGTKIIIIIPVNKEKKKK